MQESSKIAVAALLLTLAILAIAASAVDLGGCLAYSQRVAAACLYLLHPVRLLRVLIAFAAGALRVLIASPLPYIAVAWWLVQRHRSSAPLGGSS